MLADSKEEALAEEVAESRRQLTMLCTGRFHINWKC